MSGTNREGILKHAKSLCSRWQMVHQKLLQIDNHQRKLQLLYEEHVLERSFNSLVESYREYTRYGG